MEEPSPSNPLRGVASTIARLESDSTVVAPALAETRVAPPAGGGAGAPGAIAAPPRFEPLGLLGEGGMGRVTRARDRDLGREIAVKQLRPELAGDARMLEQFLWEARVTAHLDHPNIVPVHDLGVAPDGQLYFTLKLVRGTALDAALARLAGPGGEAETGLHLPRRLRLFLQICHAVSFAHARGVLHRDLKPANVLLGEHGEVFVTDWGIAIPMPDPSGDALLPPAPAALAASSVGTPMYMSPEQARGDALDARSDVFALGAILYELVALRRAFDADTVAAVLDRVRRADKPPLSAAAPAASSALIAITDKATAFDPADRYASVRALADEVETVLDGRTPDAEDASLLRQAARFYVSRDPAIGRLRVMDIDLWVGGSSFVGAGLGMMAAPYAGWLRWLLVGVGAAMAIPPFVAWLRNRHGRGRSRGE